MTQLFFGLLSLVCGALAWRYRGTLLRSNNTTPPRPGVEAFYCGAFIVVGVFMIVWGVLTFGADRNERELTVQSVDRLLVSKAETWRMTDTSGQEYEMSRRTGRSLRNGGTYVCEVREQVKGFETRPRLSSCTAR